MKSHKIKRWKSCRWWYGWWWLWELVKVCFSEVDFGQTDEWTNKNMCFESLFREWKILCYIPSSQYTIDKTSWKRFSCLFLSIQMFYWRRFFASLSHYFLSNRKIGKYLFWEILRRFQPLELCEHFCWHSKSWQVFCHCESYLTKKQLLISFPTIIEKDKLHCKVCCNKLLEKWGTQYMTLFFPLPCPKLITCRHGAFSGSWVKTETFFAWIHNSFFSSRPSPICKIIFKSFIS